VLVPEHVIDLNKASRLHNPTISSSAKEPKKPTRTATTKTAITKPATILKNIAPPTRPVRSTATTRNTTSSRNQTHLGSSIAMKKPVDIPPAKRKRKEYDVKGRLQDLEEQYVDTSTKLEQSNQLIDTMTAKLDDSQSTSIFILIS
jgi:hypothetical protein